MKGGLPIMKSTFQKRLQERMDELGFRQADLAERTGLSKSRISHYINGRYEAKQEALYLLAKALDVNEAWLMGHDVPKERSIAVSCHTVSALRNHSIKFITNGSITFCWDIITIE